MPLRTFLIVKDDEDRILGFPRTKPLLRSTRSHRGAGLPDAILLPKQEVRAQFLLAEGGLI